MTQESTESFEREGSDAALGRKAVKGTLWLGIVNLLSKGSQVVVTLVLAAFLTEGDLGLVAVAISLGNIAQVVQSMGVYDIVARTARDAHAMAGTVMTLSLAGGTFFGVVGIAGSQFIADSLNAPGSATLIAIVAVGLPFSAVGGVQMALMHRELAFRKRMLPDAGSAVIGAGVTTSLAIAGFGAESMAIGVLTTAILQPIFGAVVGVRVLPGWDSGCAVEAMRWVRIVGPAAIIQTLLVNVDYSFVSKILGPVELGIYSLAYRIAWVPYIAIAVVLAAVAFPVLSSLLRDGLQSSLHNAVEQLSAAMILIVGGAYVLIGLMSYRVVVLAERWEPTGPVLAILCVYGFAVSLSLAWYEVIRVLGHLWQYLILHIIQLAILVAGLAMFTHLGVIAVAVVQVASAAILLPVVWIALARTGAAPGLGATARSFIGLALPALGCVGLAWLIRESGWTGEPSSLIGAIVEGSVLTVCFAAIALACNRRAIRGVLGLRRGAVEN